MTKTDLRSLTFEEMESLCASLGLANYRAKQLFSALYKVASIDEITTLSKDLRETLSETHTIDNLVCADKQVSKKTAR